MAPGVFLPDSRARRPRGLRFVHHHALHRLCLIEHFLACEELYAGRFEGFGGDVLPAFHALAGGDDLEGTSVLPWEVLLSFLRKCYSCEEFVCSHFREILMCLK